MEKTQPPSKQQLDPQDEHMITQLIAYQRTHGDCHVPTGNSRYVQQDRRKWNISDDLASWVVQQRKLYRRLPKKKSRYKIPESIATKLLILESMGFIWSCREAHWQRCFNLLKKYGRENGGSLRVSRLRDPQMFDWTDQQRKAYHRGKLSSEREAMLRDIGFIFNPQEAAWWHHYEMLRDYKEKHGHVMVPTTNERRDALGGWVARQRRHFQLGELEESRIQALDKLGFTWAVQEESWENYYAQLLEFFKIHNHTRIPRSAGSLWGWTDRQRRRLKAKVLMTTDANNQDEDTGLLDESRLKKLLDLGLDPDEVEGVDKDVKNTKRLIDLDFEVALRDEDWMKSYRELCAFKEKHGHFSVPKTHPGLSNWVRHQRYLYHKNKLAESRVALLNDIDFSWTAEAARWNRMYEELLSFYRDHGHTRVPTTNAALYRWTNQQRHQMLSGKLSGNSSHVEGRTQKHIALKEILSTN